MAGRPLRTGASPAVYPLRRCWPAPVAGLPSLCDDRGATEEGAVRRPVPPEEDLDTAVVEAAIERNHTADSDAETGDETPTRAEIDLTELRVDGDDTEPEDGADEDTREAGDPALADLVAAFVERFNARDLDGLVELLARDLEAPGLGEDRGGLVRAIEDLWDRDPTCLLTSAWLEDQPVALLWESGDGRWWRNAVLVFEAEGDTLLGLVELVDDPAAVDAAESVEPEREFEEGARWEEWEEGADG